MFSQADAEQTITTERLFWPAFLSLFLSAADYYIDWLFLAEPLKGGVEELIKQAASLLVPEKIPLIWGEFRAAECVGLS